MNPAGKLVNGAGSLIQLRGFSMAGLDDTDVAARLGGWGGKPPNDWATQGEPPWAAYAAWRPNVVRIPLNAQSFLGVTVAATSGPEGAPSWNASTVGSADALGTYRRSIKEAIASARAIGCYIILDMHESRPKATLDGVTYYLNSFASQDAFLDADTCLPFWTSADPALGLVAWLRAHCAHPATGTIDDILFELVNEPTINTDAGRLSADFATVMRAGGTDARIQNYTQNGGGTNYYVNRTWNVVGYQTILDGIRALGARNICICNGPQYANSIDNYKAWLPADSLSPPQVAIGWHPYPVGDYPSNVHPGTADPGMSFGASGKARAMSYAEAALAAGLPVIVTEDGDAVNGTAATAGSPHTAFMTDWCDRHGVSYLQWCFNGVQPYGTRSARYHATGYAADGKTIVPLQGAGQVMHDWMVNHA